jgi:hypothetical protein
MLAVWLGFPAGWLGVLAASLKLLTGWAWWLAGWLSLLAGLAWWLVGWACWLARFLAAPAGCLAVWGCCFAGPAGFTCCLPVLADWLGLLFLWLDLWLTDWLNGLAG